MILYGNSMSPFVRKVMIVAAEKGIAYELKQPGRPPNVDPGFLATSPLKKMPALADGDFKIADSTAIVTYLEALHPSPALLPAEPKARAKAIWFEEFADTELVKIVFKSYFNRIVSPRFYGKPGNDAVAAEGDKEVVPYLDYLETVVPAAGGFLTGPAISVGDIAVASMFVNIIHCDVPIDPAKYSRTLAWLRSIHARPNFASIIEAEKKVLAA